MSSPFILCACNARLKEMCLLIDFSDLNLLDWSCNNHLAVALGGFVYLWNAASGDIVQLCQTESPDCYIGVVSWIKEGNYIALGDSNGAVQVSKCSFGS